MEDHEATDLDLHKIHGSLHDDDFLDRLEAIKRIFGYKPTSNLAAMKLRE